MFRRFSRRVQQRSSRHSSSSSDPRLHARVSGSRQRVPSRSERARATDAGGEVAYRDLREFVRALEKKDQLEKISAEVDPVLEITEITDRVVKGGGPGVLFGRGK